MATKVKKEVEISAKDLASKTLESLTYKFKKFEGAVKSVQNAAGNVARSARGILTTFGGVATAAVAAINKMATQADDLNTMANVVGLNVEAYQKLRYAAEQNDVSTEGFDKSLRMLSKSMGELRAGTGSLYTKLKRVNPQLLRQLRGARDNETAFRLMMNAINKTTNAQKKAYLATAAFGKSGQELISLANIGADAMEKFEKEAEGFGLVSKEGGNAADEWGRAVVRVRKAMEGVGYIILNKVLPTLVPVVNKISEWISKNREMIADKVIEWGTKFFNVLKSIAAIMGPLIKLFSKYSWLVYALFIGKAAGLILNIIKLGGALWTLIKAVWALNAALLANPITWIVAGIVALIAGVAALIYYWKDLTAWFQKLCDKYPALKRVFEGLKKWANVVYAPLKALYSVLVAIVDAVKWVDNLLKDKGLTIEQKAAADDKLREMGILPQYSPVNSPGLQMSPLANSQVQIATSGGIRQSADINVRFDNMPQMTRIDTVSNDANLDLEIYRGVNGGTIQ